MTRAAGTALRVVFVCVPQSGHLLPLFPLARQFAADGDEVVVASGPSAAGAVAEAGLTFRRVCPDLDDWFATLAGRTRGRPGDGLAPAQVERYFVPRLFAEVGLDAMADDLDAVVREIRPDLLVYEPFALAAPMVAARQGILAVRHAIGLSMDPLVLDLVGDAVTPAWRAAGLQAPRAAGANDGASLRICPPSLDPLPTTHAGVSLPLRPTPLPEPSSELPVDLPYPDNPLVYVTLGTFSNNDLSLFRLILDALADLPVTVLATVGHDNDVAALGDLPANAAATRFVPQAALLPHCAAVVHHAGAGTTFGLLAHGLPSVALPQSADNFSFAERLAATGAALRLLPDEVSGATVRAAVRSVLDEATYGLAARSVAGEIAAMPGPDEVTGLLRDALAASRAR